LMCLFVGYACFNTYLGAAISIAHSVVPAKMRAFSSAVLFLVLNLIGLGFGPLFVGFMSDLLAESMGVESLRWAMASTLLVTLISITCFFKAARYIKDDLVKE